MYNVFQKCKFTVKRANLKSAKCTFERVFCRRDVLSLKNKKLKSALCTFQNCSFECKLRFKKRTLHFWKMHFWMRGFLKCNYPVIIVVCFKTSILVIRFPWGCVLYESHLYIAWELAALFRIPCIGLLWFAEFRYYFPLFTIINRHRTRLSVGYQKW